ncbi:MATE family efflux transporter [Oculatella sp. LEGE 06141]|uniref:guanitoxin biosynthesis MATE family efflux transporter GntT n=1 Tax=Oculatella sp. LEGE 06141 TaxID=1828648 RepID=UPI001880EA22|nr:guanitoxin biosynthesis MATE family efflux transporter GntT [Oculatella sp. LEGE 06141]MBE9179554.1 MATE family efflux transporter [Oculatella sp. LEGE 06141]
MTPIQFRLRFFRLALVNILANLLVPLAGLVDTAFLGHLADIRHLAGVALATVLFNYIYWTFGFLRMATTGTTAQAQGRQDDWLVMLIGVRNASIAIVLGGIILLLQYPIRELGFVLLSATPEVKASGQAYYDAMIWGAPATLLNFVLIGWFLGREQGGKVFVLSAVSSGANVGLDYWFITQLGWASAGAGAATAMSQYLAVWVGLGFIWYELPQLRSRLAPTAVFAPSSSLMQQIIDPVALKAAFTLNRDILIRTFALVSTFALFTNISATLGTVILAANTVLMQVVSLAAYFVDGLAFATESFAGTFRGQRSIAQLSSLVRLAGSISLLLGLAFAVGFILLPESLFGLLTSHADVLAQIRRSVWWLLPVLGFGSLAYMLDGYFLGLTEGRALRQSTLAAAIVGCVPMAIAAWQFPSTQLLWFALTLFMATRAITLGWRVPRTLVDDTYSNPD